MDLIVVFEAVGAYFKYLCSIKLVVAGYSFTVGALFMWCGIASILIWFIKELQN